MKDQNEREWPSFSDILDELNSLGELRSTRRVSSNPLRDVSPPVAHDPATISPPHEPLKPMWAELTPEPDETSAQQHDQPGAPQDEVAALPTEAELEVEANLEGESDETGPADEAGVADFGAAFGSDTIGTPIGQPLGAIGSPIGQPLTSDTPTDHADTEPADSTADHPNAIDWNATEWAEHEDPSVMPSELADAPGEPGEVFAFDPMALSPSTEDTTPEVIDSVATANEIESDLQELFTLPEEPVPATSADIGSDEDGDADNVVPLHPSTGDYTEAVVGLDEDFDPARPRVETTPTAAEFVSIEQTGTTTEDSWDYLRPDEDEDVGGFWSKRPKLFGGGDDKKSGRKGRKSDDEDELNGPPCPQCSHPGRIDLDDPIGGKLHLSCLNCDHVWSQFAERGQESA